jgi:transposase
MSVNGTAKLNGVEPMAWLTDVLERIVSGRTKANELHTLLPWNWQPAAAARPDPNYLAAA